MKVFEVYLIVKTDEDTSPAILEDAVSELLQNGLSDSSYSYIASAEVEYAEELPDDMAPDVKAIET